MIAGFAVGGFWIWPWLEGLTETNARLAAERDGAILYHHNFGFGLLIGLFAWIFVSGALVGALPLLSRRLMASAFCESILDQRARSGRTIAAQAARWGIEKALKGQATQTNPEDFVHGFTMAWVKPFAIGAFVLTLLSNAALVKEIHVHGIYTAEGYEQTHIFPIPPTSHLWSDAVALEVGCNHVTGRNASDKPVYEVIFGDGSNVRLEYATPLRGSWLDAMGIIDAQVVSSHAVVRPWNWLGRTSMHPDCLAAQREMLSDGDYDRLLHLLRQ